MSQSSAEVDPAESSAPEMPARTPWYLQWSIVLGAVGLVLAPAISGAYPSEVARWHDAAAREKYLSSDLPGALAELEEAFTWNSSSAGRYQRRAEYRHEAHDYAGSLEDWNEALKLSPENPRMLLGRANTYQHLARHEEAIADHKAVDQQVLEGRLDPLKFPRTSTLNGLSYARAVGNLELSDGLKGAQSLISDAYVLEQVGYLQVSRKDWPRAEKRLREAEELLKQVLDVQKKKYQETDDKIVQQRILARAEPEEKRLASVQFQLARAYRKLNRTSDAETYEKLYRQWNKAEKELMKELPRIGVSWARANAYAAYIDTRGYLHYRLGDYISARHDLELAFELAELEQQRSAERFKEMRKEITDIREYESLSAQHQRGVAVILYHRALVYEKLGLDELTEKDLRRVREEFDCTPDDKLF